MTDKKRKNKPAGTSSTGIESGGSTLKSGQSYGEGVAGRGAGNPQQVPSDHDQTREATRPPEPQQREEKGQSTQRDARGGGDGHDERASNTGRRGSEEESGGDSGNSARGGSSDNR